MAQKATDPSPLMSKRQARPPLGYYPEKAAELTAYFLIKIGSAMSKLKLVKLLYLAERRHAERFNCPMFLDRHFAIKHGPVPTTALSGIDGDVDQDVWPNYITRTGHSIAVKEGVQLESLGNLSEADRQIADELLGKFGSMTSTQIRNWTHKHLPEYREKEAALEAEPEDGRKRFEIMPADMARGFGHRSPQKFARAVAAARAIGGK